MSSVALEPRVDEGLVQGFVVSSELGQGASSVVYRAQRGADTFAIKILKTMEAGRAADAAIRFRKEGAALARLRHPGLVRVFEIGECKRGPYLAMELIEGEDLSKVLTRGPVSDEVALKLARMLAGAL